MNSIKRFVAFSLAVTMMLCAALPAASADMMSDAAEPPASTLFFERVGGALGSILGRALKTVTFTDEAGIKSSVVIFGYPSFTDFISRNTESFCANAMAVIKLIFNFVTQLVGLII